MRTRIVAALLTLALPNGAGAQAANTAVKVSGSTSVYGKVFAKGGGDIERESGARVEAVSNGSRQGLSDLLANKCDIAMLSAALDDLMARLTPSEQGLAKRTSLVVTPLAENRLEFIVHPSNTVKRLMVAQIADLFSGKVTNWKEVGGPDLNVEIVSNQFSSGQRAVLESEVLKGASVTASAKHVVNDSQIPPIVRQVPGALGHTADAKVPGVTTLATDRDVVQPLALVTRGKPTGSAAKVVDAIRKTFSR
jgi:phosphate transport system substrate-binding protein